MKRSSAVLIVVMVALLQVDAVAQPPAADDQQTLRARITERFEIVPLPDDVALRPRERTGDVRLIEIADDAILVNGAPVTGGELRKRIGAADADLVLRLSYLSPEARRAIVATPGAPADPAIETPPELERPAADGLPPVPPLPPRAPDPHRRHAAGDRVRVFGNVDVHAGETIAGQVVAVMGSVRVDGEVGDQVVAVMGSVDLGPNAVVRGDVVSVGGRVRRTESTRIDGSVTEISFADPNLQFNFGPMGPWRGGPWSDHLSALPRLMGTTFRFLLLVLLASIAFLIARPMVEASAQRVSDNPVQATLVGLVAQILLVPALVMTIIVLAISIIGIPLLLLVPFALLLLVLLALAGFSGTVYAIGQWMRRRLGLVSSPPFVDVFLGVLVLLLPILVARLLALGGGPVAPLVMLLLATGFVIEFIAWSSGFGAVLTNGFARWQARRAARVIPPPPPATP